MRQDKSLGGKWFPVGDEDRLGVKSGPVIRWVHFRHWAGLAERLRVKLMSSLWDTLHLGAWPGPGPQVLTSSASGGNSRLQGR